MVGRAEKIEQIKKEILTLERVAELFGVHVATVRNWCKRGLPSVQIGHRVLIRKQWLIDFIVRENIQGREVLAKLENRLPKLKRARQRKKKR